MTTPDRPPARKAGHLIDLNAPRRRRDPAEVRAAQERLQRVQRWVLSTLAATTILHLSIGLVVAAIYLDTGFAEQIGVCVIAAAFGVLAVAVARAIHRVPIPSPWLLLGLVPGLVGVAWVVWR